MGVSGSNVAKFHRLSICKPDIVHAADLETLNKFVTISPSGKRKEEHVVSKKAKAIVKLGPPRSRSTSCIGGALQRAQIQEAKIANRREEHLRKLKVVMRARFAAAKLPDLFNLFDKDGNGNITRGEFRSGLVW
jgi:hypothetical protein